MDVLRPHCVGVPRPRFSYGLAQRLRYGHAHRGHRCASRLGCRRSAAGKLGRETPPQRSRRSVERRGHLGHWPGAHSWWRFGGGGSSLLDTHGLWRRLLILPLGPGLCSHGHNPRRGLWKPLLSSGCGCFVCGDHDEGALRYCGYGSAAARLASVRVAESSPGAQRAVAVS